MPVLLVEHCSTALLVLVKGRDISVGLELMVINKSLTGFLKDD